MTVSIVITQVTVSVKAMQVTVSGNNFVFYSLTLTFHKTGWKTFKAIISGLHVTIFVNILPKSRYCEGRNYIYTNWLKESFITFVFTIDLLKMGTSCISRKRLMQKKKKRGGGGGGGV